MNLTEYPDVGTVADVAQILAVDERTIRSEIKAGRLECVRVGRLIRVTRVALLRYLKIDEEEPQQTSFRVIEGGGP